MKKDVLPVTFQAAHVGFFELDELCVYHCSNLRSLIAKLEIIKLTYP